MKGKVNIICRGSGFFGILLAISLWGATVAAAGNLPRGALLISIDGLKPEYVLEADELGLNIPHLRQIASEGAYATGVKGVLSTSTYPSHTTIVTGFSPAKHGIVQNRPFDPENVAPLRWYWYTEDIKVPTLWEAAAQADLKVAAVSWPVTVGAGDIHYNIPEFAGTRTEEDLKMVRGFATPGLMRELEKEAGEYIIDFTYPIPRDWARTRYTLEMMRLHKPEFLTIHLTAPDTVQHRYGPYTQQAMESVEEVDRMVGKLVEAYRSEYPDGLICIVSDHGFAKVNRVFKIDAAFIREGLISVESDGGTLVQAGTADWVAMPWRAGGSAAVYLKDRNDQEVREQVRKFLNDLAADPENGISAILEREEIDELGGDPQADFWVDLKPGFIAGQSLRGELAAPVSDRGTHGYVPTHREMDAVFLISGGGIPENLNLGRIDMRHIAPTLAATMGIELSGTELAPLVWLDQAANED